MTITRKRQIISDRPKQVQGVAEPAPRPGLFWAKRGHPGGKRGGPKTGKKDRKWGPPCAWVGEGYVGGREMKGKA